MKQQHYESLTSGVCALAQNHTRSYDRTVTTLRQATGLFAARDDLSFEAPLNLEEISAEDFALMLEVDIAFINWLDLRGLHGKIISETSPQI